MAFHIRVKEILGVPVVTAPGYNGRIPAPREGELLSYNFGNTPWRSLVHEDSAGLQYLLTSQDQGHVTPVGSQDIVGEDDGLGIFLKIDTIHKDRLRSSHFMDLSGKSQVRIFPVGPKTDVYHDIIYCPSEVFPIGSHGFLYCHTAGECPEVRFRVTPRDDPNTFSSGHDMVLPNGLPWRLHMGSLTSDNSPLARVLVSDNLLDPEALSLWLDIPFQLTRRCTIVSIGEDFLVKFSSFHRVWLAVAGRLHRLMLSNLFCNTRAVLAHHQMPYSGMGPPIEGDLVRRHDYVAERTPRTWRLDKVPSFPIRP